MVEINSRTATSSGEKKSPTASNGPVTSGEPSKFRRFLKRFGRRTSDDGNESVDGQVNGIENITALDADKKSNSSRSRAGSRSGSTKSKRGDSLLGGRFFQTNANAPPVPTQRNGNTNIPQTSQRIDAGFSGTNVGGIADTLTIPSGTATPPPQLEGVPHHDPLSSRELINSAAPQLAANNSNGQIAQLNDKLDNSNNHIISRSQNDAALSPHSSYGSSHTSPSFDNDSSSPAQRRRDSLDNRTMDTAKSRASTKPTTLMSMDTRENQPGASYTPMAQIAQYRHGDAPPTSSRIRDSNSVGRDENIPMSSNTSQAAIQFATPPPMGRSASGTIVQLPSQGEAPHESPYTNVPSLSRPHPANNPNPTGIPADNASMLTLASSTAAASIAGGAASSRGHSHAAPSFGGARSIGGSLMGERRNSSDTSASVKALPPLSRRGSDSSSRTGLSVAASATGRNSAQAMIVGAGSTAGPGAPGDRISIHRTPSQRTIATQLSIPLSTSNQALAAGQGTNETNATAIATTIGDSGSLLAAPMGNSASLLGSSPLAQSHSQLEGDILRTSATPSMVSVNGGTE